jgi:transcription antitermination factor NusG
MRLIKGWAFFQSGLWKREFPSKNGEAMSEILELETIADHKGTFCAGGEVSPRWFAVYTTPRHEKYVNEILAERGIETFLPLFRTARQWQKSRPVVLELPLFPTYIFVRIAREARVAVLSMPGVLSIVGSPREPWPLPDLEIEALRSGLLERKIEPYPYLIQGERVRITAGMMAGVEGVLVRKKNDLRVVLSLDMIMRSVAVEVDAGDIEPASTTPVRMVCYKRWRVLPVNRSLGRHSETASEGTYGFRQTDRFDCGI